MNRSLIIDMSKVVAVDIPAEGRVEGYIDGIVARVQLIGRDLPMGITARELEAIREWAADRFPWLVIPAHD